MRNSYLSMMLVGSIAVGFAECGKPAKTVDQSFPLVPTAQENPLFSVTETPPGAIPNNAAYPVTDSVALYFRDSTPFAILPATYLEDKFNLLTIHREGDMKADDGRLEHVTVSEIFHHRDTTQPREKGALSQREVTIAAGTALEDVFFQQELVSYNSPAKHYKVGFGCSYKGEDGDPFHGNINTIVYKAEDSALQAAAPLLDAFRHNDVSEAEKFIEKHAPAPHHTVPPVKAPPSSLLLSAEFN